MKHNLSINSVALLQSIIEAQYRIASGFILRGENF